MQLYQNQTHQTGHTPAPPEVCPAALLQNAPAGLWVDVAGLVLVRQRPGTARGVVFLTLEDETGVVNIVIWRNLYETYRRAIISGRMIRVNGQVQRENTVIHVVAKTITDVSFLLDRLPEFDSGDISGTWTPATVRSMRDFQSARAITTQSPSVAMAQELGLLPIDRP